MMKKEVFKVLLLWSTLVGQALAGTWHPSNHPERMKSPGMKPLVYDLKSLGMETVGTKKSKMLPEVPASDTYWATVYGGIARRWQQGDGVIKESDLLSLAQLKKIMKEKGIIDAEVSPAEKLDIINCAYNYPASKCEIDRCRDRVQNPDGNEWEGLCHNLDKPGHFKEAKSVVVTNKQGLKVRMNTSDQNAWLMKYFDLLEQVASDRVDSCFLGNRSSEKHDVKDWKGKKRRDYNDVNAGSLFLSVVNAINQDRLIVFDRTTDFQVWNQPIFGYDLEVLGESAEFDEGYDDVYALNSDGEEVPVHQDAPKRKPSKDKVKEVKVALTVHWLNEIEPHRNPMPDAEEKKAKNTYHIILELDNNGKIVGGRYAEKSPDYPDFLWSSKVVKGFENQPFKGLIVAPTTKNGEEFTLVNKKRFAAQGEDEQVIDLETIDDVLKMSGAIPSNGPHTIAVPTPVVDDVVDIFQPRPPRREHPRGHEVRRDHRRNGRRDGNGPRHRRNPRRGGHGSPGHSRRF